jgi:hypothetical protein
LTQNRNDIISRNKSNVNTMLRSILVFILPLNNIQIDWKFLELENWKTKFGGDISQKEQD